MQPEPSLGLTQTRICIATRKQAASSGDTIETSALAFRIAYPAGWAMAERPVPLHRVALPLSLSPQGVRPSGSATPDIFGLVSVVRRVRGE